MPPRMGSTRHAAKKVRYTDEVVESDSSGDASDSEGAIPSKGRKQRVQKKNEDASESEEDEEERPRNKKKQNKDKGTAAAQVKKDNPIDRLPFELVSEIFSLTTPKYLLSLARTNKHYRSILMSKRQSNSIWKASRRSWGLPDLAADDFSEPAYAALVFGTRCDHCSRYSPAWVDPFLRLRLCKACRKDHLVKIARDFDRDKRYHPAILRCVVRSPPVSENYPSASNYVLRSDLEYQHKKLSVLQEDDEFDDSLQVPDNSEMGSLLSVPSRSRSRRGERQRKIARKSYREDEDEPEDVVIRKGGRVEAYIEERQALLEKITMDGNEIKRNLRKVLDRFKVDQAKIARATWYTNVLERGHLESELEHRIAQVPGYAYSDVSLLASRSLKALIEPGTSLTEKRWKTIQPKVLALIDKAKAKQRSDLEKQHVLERESSRKTSIRPYYDSLKASSDSTSCFPLFLDFLLLPSIKALWQDDSDKYKTVDDSTWKLLLPLIKAEIDDYHLEFLTAAIRLILSTHNEYASDDQLDEAVQSTLEGDLDSFFGLASSLVICGGGCRGERTSTIRLALWVSRREVSKKHGGFLGTVPEVVKHLHRAHNINRGVYTGPAYSSPSPAEKRRTEPAFRICLPLQVASTISALIEVGGYSSDVAKVKDLDRLDAGRYKYENATTSKKLFFKWRDLVDRVSLDTSKAERARPPIHLPAPLVVYFPSNAAPPPDEETKSNGEDDDIGPDEDET